jgi:hypothetical protein
MALEVEGRGGVDANNVQDLINSIINVKKL